MPGTGARPREVDVVAAGAAPDPDRELAALLTGVGIDQEAAVAVVEVRRQLEGEVVVVGEVRPVEPELDRQLVGGREVEGCRGGVVDAVEAGGGRTQRARRPHRHAVEGGGGAGTDAVGEGRAGFLVEAPEVGEAGGGADRGGIGAEHGDDPRRGRRRSVFPGHSQSDRAFAGAGVRLRRARRRAGIGLIAAVAVQVPFVLDDRAVGRTGARGVEADRCFDRGGVGGDGERGFGWPVLHGDGTGRGSGLTVLVGHSQPDRHFAGAGVRLRRARRRAGIGLIAAVAVQVPFVLDDRAVGVGGGRGVEVDRGFDRGGVG